MLTTIVITAVLTFAASSAANRACAVEYKEDEFQEVSAIASIFGLGLVLGLAF